MNSNGVFAAVAGLQAAGLAFRSLVEYRLAESSIELAAKRCPFEGSFEEGRCLLTDIPLHNFRGVPVVDALDGQILQPFYCLSMSDA